MEKKLNYDFFKENVAMVEIKKDLDMGNIETFLEMTNGVMISGLEVDENNNAIIKKGTKGKFNVQPHNNWFEMGIDGYWFDVALEDNELNEFIELIEIIGPNKYYSK
jgi:hypothetical protein